MTVTAPWARDLFMIGNAHIDTAWLWPWQEGFQEARATLASAVKLLGEDEDYIFTTDQVVLLEWVERADPELFEQVAKWITAGRLEVVGGWWVEPDCNLPTGEAFVRQGLLGQRFLASRFGMTATVGCNIDPFGHHVMLPQILRGQGMDSYCFLRPAPHESTLPGSAFWWEAPDGSRVLAYRIPHEYTSPGDDLAYHVEKAVNQLSPDARDAMVFYGVGNHGGGPTRGTLASIAALNRRGALGHLRLSGISTYFDHLRATRTDIPVWRDDLQLHAPGCYSAHSGIKGLNRRAESALLAAERFAVVAARRAGTVYPAADLTRAWKQLLLNQFHDVLPGTAIETVMEDAERQLGEVICTADRITNLAVQTMAGQIEIDAESGALPLLVFNPHPWTLSTDVEVEAVIDGASAHVVTGSGDPVRTQPVQTATVQPEIGRRTRQRLLFPVSVPPLGHRLYRICVGPGETVGPPVEVDGRTITNEFLALEVDAGTGWLRSLVDRRSGVDLLAGASGAHTVVTPDSSDTWGHRVLSYVADGNPFAVESVTVVETGPHRGAIRVESAVNRSTLSETFSLSAGTPVVRVDVTLDWREQLTLFKLRVPTGLADPRATYEVPFGSLGRPVDSIERPGQSWVDISGTAGGRNAGLAVVNNAKYAYDFTGADVGLTAARSPVFAWHHPRALDPSTKYSYQDQGVQRFTYLLVPHDGDWLAADVHRWAAALLMPPVLTFEHAHPGRLPGDLANLESPDPRILLTALKASEDNPADTVVRAVELAGVGGPADLRMPMFGRDARVDFGPFEIKTLLVPADRSQPLREVDLIERGVDEDRLDGDPTEADPPAVAAADVVDPIGADQ